MAQANGFPEGSKALLGFNEPNFPNQHLGSHCSISLLLVAVGILRLFQLSPASLTSVQSPTLVQLGQQLRANLDPYTAPASLHRFVQVTGMSQVEATAVLCISRLPCIGKTLSNWPKTTTFLLSCATHFVGVRA